MSSEKEGKRNYVKERKLIDKKKKKRRKRKKEREKRNGLFTTLEGKGEGKEM